MGQVGCVRVPVGWVLCQLVLLAAVLSLCFTGTSAAATRCLGAATERAHAGARTEPPGFCDAKSVDDAGVKRLEREECPGGHIEGKCAHPYNDSLGFCTIGVGHLLHKSKCTKTDRKVWAKETVSDLEALLHRDLATREADLNRLKRSLRIKLNQCQFDALIDLLFNGGPSWFMSPKSRIYKALKARRLDEVPPLIQQALPSKMTGKTRRALQGRRAREASEFKTPLCCQPPPLSGTFKGSATNPYYGYTLTWSGSATLAPSFTRTGPGLYPDTWEYYTLTSGNVSWLVSGSWNGCTWSGSGTATLGTAAESFAVELNGPPDASPHYSLDIEGDQTKALPVTLTCPNGTTPSEIGYGGGRGSWAYSNVGPTITTDGTTVSGSNSSSGQHWTWDMRFR